MSDPGLSASIGVIGTAGSIGTAGLATAGPEFIDLTTRFRDPSFAGERLILDDTHEAEVFGSTHPIVQGLIEIEIRQLVALGDSEGETRSWLANTAGTIWVAIFRQNVAHVAANVEGLVRLTGANESHRMIEDLAYLVKNADIAAVEADLAKRLRVTAIAPFVDLTTLAITEQGAQTNEARFANLFRLLQIVVFVFLRSAQADQVRCGAAMVHPSVYKYIPMAEVPMFDLGYGVMLYKLSDANLTPMPTQVIGVDFDLVCRDVKTGSKFMQSCGALFERNGYSLDLPA